MTLTRSCSSEREKEKRYDCRSFQGNYAATLLPQLGWLVGGAGGGVRGRGGLSISKVVQQQSFHEPSIHTDWPHIESHTSKSGAGTGFINSRHSSCRQMSFNPVAPPHHHSVVRGNRRRSLEEEQQQQQHREHPEESERW